VANGQVVIGLTSSCALSPFAAAIPARDVVKMRVPGASSSAQQALTAGAQADFYSASRDAAIHVNAGVQWVFDVVDRVIVLPPTTQTGNTAVWGPTLPQGLEKNAFRFTVVEVEPGHFTYHLDARPKASSDDADFQTIFEGDAHPDAQDRGHGSMDLHLSAARSVDDSVCLQGDVHVDYDATIEPRTLGVHFVGVGDACKGEPTHEARFAYSEASDHAGALDFVVVGNVHKAEQNEPLEETLAIRTRWQADGQGRSDVRVSGGEIAQDLATHVPGTQATTVDVSECWDASFTLDFQATTPSELGDVLQHPASGDASACVFTDASFATL
jgi:hypothetical protein